MCVLGRGNVLQYLEIDYYMNLCENTCLCGFQTGKTQTSVLEAFSHNLQFWNHMYLQKLNERYSVTSLKETY